MSTKRSIAFWELCRQGLPLLADAANDCWERGKRFELETDVQVAKSLKALIEQCNWEIERPLNSH
jgi:ubiquinone biosynthesis protein UbiJ